MMDLARQSAETIAAAVNTGTASALDPGTIEVSTPGKAQSVIAGHRGILEALEARDPAAAQALAAGQIDLARLDGAVFGPVSSNVRSVLTTRDKGALNRLPVVVSTLNTSRARALGDLAGASLVFGGQMKASLEVPKAALASYGADEAFFGDQPVAQDYETAAAQLRSGAAQAMVLHAGAWQKLCRGDQPGEDLCADLQVVWRQRQVAEQAWAVRTDMTDDRRFRLIGIHVAMHNEAPDAFAWAAGPAAEEFEPTEAKALIHQGPTVGS